MFLKLSGDGVCSPIFHGSHDTVFPVNLPSWTPEAAAKEVTAGVRSCLVTQLLKLHWKLDRPPSFHTKDASLQSEASYCSNFSTDSDPTIPSPTTVQ